MEFRGAVSAAVYEQVAGDPQPAHVLGVCSRAIYLQAVRSGPVVAIVSHDAARLPCAIVIPLSHDELPLTLLRPSSQSGPAASVGDGMITWETQSGRISVRSQRVWRPARVPHGVPSGVRLGSAATALRSSDIGIGVDRTSAFAQAPDERSQQAATVALLGFGPGLTPSGDDVLAGYFAGCHAFGLLAGAVASVVDSRAAHATSALSAQLLHHAMRDEVIPELAGFIDALLGRRPLLPMLGALFAVGHTSGRALALGSLIAGRRVLAGQRRASVSQILAPTGGAR